MALILDTGALIEFDRGNRKVAALVKAAEQRGETVLASSGCVAQAWRGGRGRQALLARLLKGVDERGIGPEVSRVIGALCVAANRYDVVDGHVALLADAGDLVLTSDVSDLKALLRARAVTAAVESC